MVYVKEDLAEVNQEVKGVIIGFDDDIKIHRALSVTTNIEFYKCKVDFKLYQYLSGDRDYLSTPTKLIFYFL